MNDHSVTLAMLGGLEADASGLPISGADRKKLLNELSKAAAGEGLTPYDLGERLLGFLGESLRKPVAGILEEVWSQRKELREIAEKGKDKRDVEGKVVLYDHSVTWALHPSVEIHANGVEVCKMKFDCEAKLKLQGVELVIKNAWIKQIKAGKLASTISLEYKTIPLMPPCKKTIDLPKSFDLPGGGIRLGGEPRPPAVA
jgi:hypothetical protein